MLNSVTLKAKAYADDTTIDITLRDWPSLLNSINLYERASNAEINFNKSKLLQLNGKTNQYTYTSPFTDLQEDETIVSLGFPIRNGKLDYKGLWKKLINRMKSKIDQVSHRNLSIRGRVLVAKSLILSKIWYFVPAAPPNYKIKHEIMSMISKYIRSSAILPAYAELTEHIMLGGMSSLDISNSINAILAKQFLTLLTSKANWARVARSMIETHLLKSRRKLDLYQYLESSSMNTLGWPRNWKPWLVVWRNLDSSFQDSFQSPFFLKEDLTIMNKLANIFTVKTGKNYYSQKTNPIQSFFFSSEKSWFLIHKLPCDNKMIEVIWKLIHNSYSVGNRIKYFAPIRCPSCNNSRQDKNYFLLEYSTSRWLWSFVNNKTNLFTSFKTWNECFLKTFNEGKFKKNIIPATTLILIIYELHCSHMKTTYNSFTPSFSHTINSFKHRFNTQTQVIQNLSLGKKVKTGFRKLNDKFNS